MQSTSEWETISTDRAGDSLVKTEGRLECSKSCTLAPSSHTRWIFWLRLICSFPHSYFTKGTEQRNHLDLFSLEQEREYLQCCFGSNKSQEAPYPLPPSSCIRCISLITIQLSHFPLDSKFYKRAWLGSKEEHRKALEKSSESLKYVGNSCVQGIHNQNTRKPACPKVRAKTETQVSSNWGRWEKNLDPGFSSGLISVICWPRSKSTKMLWCSNPH